MGSLSQKELLLEFGFLNGVRAAASATKAAINAIEPRLGADLSRLASPITNAWKAYKGQTPLLFLKDILSKKTNIEFIELVKQEKRQANPNKPWYKKIYGPKNVTLITFTANVYHKGPRDTGREYRKYTESTALSIPNSQLSQPNSQLSQPNSQLSQPNSQLGPVKPSKTMRQARGRVIDAETTNLPGPPATKNTPANKSIEDEVTLTAEIFRTSEGLQLGEIFSTKTGHVYYSEKLKSLPNFNAEIVRYADANGVYTVQRVALFLRKTLNLTDRDIRVIDNRSTNLIEFVFNATGIPVNPNPSTTPVSPTELAKVRDALYPIFVEGRKHNKSNSKKISQVMLLEELSKY